MKASGLTEYRLAGIGIRRLVQVLALLGAATLFALSLAAFAQNPTPFTGFYQTTSLALPDGRLLVGGAIAHPVDPQYYDLAVARLLPGGAADASFNATGLLRLPIWGDYEFATALAVQPDGRIVVAGVAGDPARPLSCDFLDCEAYYVVVRLNPDGSIDPTFNGGARLILQIGPVGANVDQTAPDHTLDHIAFQPDGKILLVASGTAGSPVIARINANGTLDSGFAPPKYAVSTISFVPAIEYYNAALDHYFVTVDRSEVSLLDTGYFAGWARTRQAFHVTLSTFPNAQPYPVCRFYGNPAFGLDTHFYTANLQECNDLVDKSVGAWIIEGRDVFRITLPDSATGACPAGMIPVYRLFNNRHDVNHRFTTSVDIRNQMAARGYIREGYGPDAVSMCAEP
jgi:uncharacterized delta-60 repeat protein